METWAIFLQKLKRHSNHNLTDEGVLWLLSGSAIVLVGAGFIYYNLKSQGLL